MNTTCKSLPWIGIEIIKPFTIKVTWRTKLIGSEDRITISNLKNKKTRLNTKLVRIVASAVHWR